MSAEYKDGTRRHIKMAHDGTGIFFDGATSAKRPVLLQLSPEGLVIRDAEERDMLARWAYGRLEHIASPDGIFRLGFAG